MRGRSLDLKIVLRKLHQVLISPIWVKYPETIQFDTHNFCDLDCQYCNPQHSFNLPKGEMPISLIEIILEYFSGKRLLFSIAPFMNGEPMLDARLPQICSMADFYCHTQCLIDTNGTIYANKENLVHPNLKLVRFTISAITPETYEKVHGKPFFNRAMATLDWFLHNKLPSQQAWLHFICCKDNEHEVEKWSYHFRGIGQTIFPVHRSPDLQKDSEIAKGSQIKEPYFVDPKGNKRRLHDPKNKLKPCPNFDILAISWDGRILQCCDYPYEYNYGKVGETDILEAWQERNRNKMDNACCNSCSLKFPEWKAILDRWIK